MPLRIVDEQHYAQLASSVLHLHQFALSDGKPTSGRPPLYPALIAGLWGVAGVDDPQVVRGAQVVLGLAMVVLTYLLALRLFDRRTAIGAAAIVCVYPSLLFAGMLLLTEVLFTTLLLVFVLLYLAMRKRPAFPLALLTGATLGCAALTRSVLWPFPFVFVPLVLMSTSGTIWRRVGVSACCLLGFVLVVGPWSLRNTRIQQTFTVIDTMGGMNLRMGNYEYTPEDRMWDAVNLTGDQNWSHALGQTRADALTLTAGQKDKWAQRAAIDYMVAHPATTLRRSILKFADFWGLEREMIGALQQGLYHPPAWFAILAIIAVVLSYPIVVLSATVGMFREIPEDRWMHVLIGAVVLFIVGVHTVVFGHSRYHLPLIPFLAVYASAAWARESWRDVVRNPWVATGPALLMAILLAAWCHEVLFRDADRIRVLLQAFA